MFLCVKLTLLTVPRSLETVDRPYPSLPQHWSISSVLIAQLKLYPELILLTLPRSLGTVDWPDSLGTKFLNYEDCKKIISKGLIKNIKRFKDWAQLEERPIQIPASPEYIYKNSGWIGRPDSLGTKDKFLTYEKAKSYIKTLNFENFKQYYNWAKSRQRPENLPHSPDKVYKNKAWIDLYDWLVTISPDKNSNSSN